MSSDRFRRVRRMLARAIVALNIVAILAAACFLPFAGRYLVHEDPLEHADAILVLAGARVERWMEAVDLFKEGWAPRIILSPGQVEAAESDLLALGLRYPDESETVRDLMVKLHVPTEAIVALPRFVDNTAQEAASIDEMAVKAGWTRLIVVTSKYHTRRAGFAFRREFQATHVEIVMRASRYDRARPERWWAFRRDARYVTSELQKLLAYRLGLGG